MTQETRKCSRFRKSVGAFEYRADFAQSRSPIYVRFIATEAWDDFDWEPMPFQVADTRHDRRKAEKMIARYFRADGA